MTRRMLSREDLDRAAANYNRHRNEDAPLARDKRMLPDEEQLALLKRNGYVAGALIFSERLDEVGEIVESKHMAKPHSEKPDKAEGVYTLVKWRRQSDGRRRQSRLNTDHVMSLPICGHVE